MPQPESLPAPAPRRHTQPSLGSERELSPIPFPPDTESRPRSVARVTHGVHPLDHTAVGAPGSQVWIPRQPPPWPRCLYHRQPQSVLPRYPGCSLKAQTGFHCFPSPDPRDGAHEPGGEVRPSLQGQKPSLTRPLPASHTTTHTAPETSATHTRALPRNMAGFGSASGPLHKLFPPA